MRTEVTKRERSPYAICSLLPLMKAGAAGDAGVWPIAGVTAPRVKPPANAAPPFKNSLRAGRVEPIGFSLADEPTRKSPPQAASIRVSGCNRAHPESPGPCGESRHLVIGSFGHGFGDS